MKKLKTPLLTNDYAPHNIRTWNAWTNIVILCMAPLIDQRTFLNGVGFTDVQLQSFGKKCPINNLGKNVLKILDIFKES
jgi:hypothetical protein